MLHIILLLLKIIGIILLVMLGLLAVSVCVVCFVPLRYHGEAEVFDGVDSIKAHLKFSWLLHLVSGYVFYENKKLDWQVRILWKKINTGEKAENTEKSKRIKENKEDAEATTDRKGTSNEGQTTKKHAFFEKIKYTIQSICDKIKLLIEKKEKLETFITNEVHRASWIRIRQELVRFLRYIRPKKLILNLHFGFEDPSVTGKVLGGLSMLYPFYVKHMNVTPDFEQKVLEGDAFIKGTVRGIHAFIIVWNLIFDKNIKTTYKEIQKWKG